MRTRVKKNPLPYRAIGAYRNSTRYRAFDEARECILNPKTRCLTADEPAFRVVERHFFDMFQNPDPNMRDGKEYAIIEPEGSRRAKIKAVVANWQATQGVQAISLSVLYVRANAFVNMMEAYICYITGLVKLVVPEGHGQEAGPLPDAPQLPPGVAWAEVTPRVMEALRMMESAGTHVFGLDVDFQPEMRADYRGEIRAFAEASLKTRGLSVGTDRVGVFVRNSNTVAQAFAVAFLEADTIVKMAASDELRQQRYDRQDQMKARQRIQKQEPGLSRSRSRSAAEETPEQKKAMSAAGSLLAASDEDGDDFLRGMGAQPQSAAATRVPEPQAAAVRAGSVADLMSFDDEPELVNLNNPRDRKSRSLMTRYPRVY